MLATTEVNQDGSTNVFGGDDRVRAVGAHVGNGVIPADHGAIVRRVPYQWDGLKSFSVVTAAQITGRKVPRRRSRRTRR